MAEKKEKNTAVDDPDIRYKYIGFDVFGSKVKEYFNSEEEKKEHLESVQEYRKTHYSPLRSGTAVRANLLTTLDRVVLTIASLGLIVGSLLPWFKVGTIYGDLTVHGVLSFTAVTKYADVLALFSSTLPLIGYAFTLIAVLCLALGVLSLLMIYMPAKDNELRLGRLKKILALQFLPLVGWIALFIILLVGIKIPFGEDLANIYAIRGLGSKFDIVTIFTFAQPAMWVAFGGLVVNSVKSNDL